MTFTEQEDCNIISNVYRINYSIPTDGGDITTFQIRNKGLNLSVITPLDFLGNLPLNAVYTQFAVPYFGSLCIKKGVEVYPTEYPTEPVDILKTFIAIISNIADISWFKKKFHYEDKILYSPLMIFKYDTGSESEASKKSHFTTSTIHNCLTVSNIGYCHIENVVNFWDNSHTHEGYLIDIFNRKLYYIYPLNNGTVVDIKDYNKTKHYDTDPTLKPLWEQLEKYIYYDDEIEENS